MFEMTTDPTDPPETPTAEPAPAPAAEAPRETAPVASWRRRLWQRLTAPTQRTPADYADRRLPRIINSALDRQAHGAAHEAQVGEAVALAVDHAIGPARGGAQTPLGHLGGAVGEYAYRVWDGGGGGGR
jgi:hypothetical protein